MKAVLPAFVLCLHPQNQALRSASNELAVRWAVKDKATSHLEEHSSPTEQARQVFTSSHWSMYFRYAKIDPNTHTHTHFNNTNNIFFMTIGPQDDHTEQNINEFINMCFRILGMQLPLQRKENWKL